MSPQPPTQFRRDNSFALAYVRGRNMHPASEALLVLSILRWNRRPAFAFQILALDGTLLRFTKMAMRGVSVEHALIHAFVRFGIPFSQWMPYPAAEPQLTELASAGLLRRYLRAQRDLLATLHRARLDLYSGTLQERAEFQVQCRSDADILADIAEKRLILSAVNTRGPVKKAT